MTLGDLSPHFSEWEFRCKGFGTAGHPDHETIVSADLVDLLEAIRATTGRPLPVVSGHRCTWWNQAVGGARRSQHLQGRAADIPAGRLTEAAARRLGATGIGIRGRWVVHVDVRPSSGRVARWRY